MANIELKDLLPGKTYNIQVRSKNSNGEMSEWSNTYTFVAPKDTSVVLNNTYQTQLGEASSNSSGVLKSATFDGTLNSDFSIKVDAITGKIDTNYSGSNGWAIDYKGNAIFSNALVRGTINATSGNFTNTVTIGENSTQGKLQVGTSSSYFEIVGTNSSSTTAIKTNGASYNTSGVWLSADGRFSLGNNQLYIGTDGVLHAPGIVTNSISIDSNNYWNTSGHEGDFRVGSSSSYMLWDMTNSPSTGDGSLEVKGAIKATSGEFSGTVNILSGGSLVAGNASDGVTISNLGLVGYDNGIPVFTIPTASGTTPTIGNFKIVDTAILSDGANANLIIGDKTTDNITIRGQVGTGIVPAIFTTISGTATTSSSGNGLYIDRSGKFRLAGTNGSISMDGSGNLTATGIINATGGKIGTANNYWYIGQSGYHVSNHGTIQSWDLSLDDPLDGKGIEIDSSGYINILGGNYGTSPAVYPNQEARGLILSAVDDNYMVWWGNDNWSQSDISTYSPFSVSKTGSLTAVNATISGTITATAGTIGGFSIGTNTLSSTNNYLWMSSANPAYYTKTVSITAGSAVVTVSGGTSGIVGDEHPIIFTSGYLHAGSIILSKTSTTITLNRAAKASNASITMYFYKPQIKTYDAWTSADGFRVFSDGSIAVNDIASIPGTSGIVFNTGQIENTGSYYGWDYVYSKSYIQTATDFWAGGHAYIDGNVYSDNYIGRTSQARIVVGDLGTTQGRTDTYYNYTYGYGLFHPTYASGNNSNMYLGANGYRWIKYFGQSADSISSDSRLKIDITDSDLGLDFINSLRPVSYRYLHGGYEPVLDEGGNPLLDEDGAPIVEEREGVRIHYGFIAQEIKQSINESTGKDAAIWMLDDKNDPESLQSLAYDELESPMVKAIQELSAKIVSLESRLAALENK